MISIAIFLVFISFYMFYNTSNRAVKHVGFGFENWIETHRSFGKIIASILIATSICIHSYLFGLGSGLLVFLITLMLLASFIVLLAPLHLITYKITLLIFIPCFCFETFLL